MIYIINNGHDFRYEIQGLVSMFTSEFSFKDYSEVFSFIENIKNLEESQLVSGTEIHIFSELEFFKDKVVSKSYSLGNGKIIEECEENKFEPELSEAFGLKDGITWEEITDKFGSVKKEHKLRMKKISKNTVKLSMFKIMCRLIGMKPPWGVLTGIRPSKIVHDMIDKNFDEEDIFNSLTKEFYVDDAKARLVMDICRLERKYIYPLDENKVSLYISIPFCPTRCHYCSFPSNSLEKSADKRDDYVDALIKEMIGTSELIKKQNLEIETFYIGGGTPTALEADQLEKVIKNAFEIFDLSKIKEFTVEAGRPDSITREKLEVIKKYNATRISINPQTMCDDTLKKIGRAHNSKDVVDCFNLARELGFDNINMDIILGLVDENIDSVKHTLSEIEKLAPESLTVHTLALKRSSELKMHLEDERKRVFSTSLEQMEELIKYSRKKADLMGMNPYYMYRQKYMLGNLENIGYAKPGKECLYNMQIMEERQTNYAIGAGAVSKFVYLKENRIERVDDVKNLDQYISRVDEMVEKKYKEVLLNGNISTERY